MLKRTDPLLSPPPKKNRISPAANSKRRHTNLMELQATETMIVQSVSDVNSSYKMCAETNFYTHTQTKPTIIHRIDEYVIMTFLSDDVVNAVL